MIAFFIGWRAHPVLLTHLGLNPYSRGSVDEPSTTVVIYYPSVDSGIQHLCSEDTLQYSNVTSLHLEPFFFPLLFRLKDWCSQGLKASTLMMRLRSGLCEVPWSDLKVAKSHVGEHAGRGLFAARDIPMEATIAIDKSWKAFLFPPLIWSVVSKMEKWAQEVHDNIPSVDGISSVSTFVEGYGYAAMLLGGIHYAIDSGVLLFINHDCNGTFNYG